MSDDPTYRPQGLRIFLSYSRKDQTEVKKLFHRLQDDGFSPWLDINALASGVDWKEAINQGMKDADAVLVCLSAGVKMGVGYVSKEIEHALDLAANKPQGTIFVIPVRMAPCKVPKRLATPNAADWHLPGGYEKLAADLREKAMWDRPAAAIPAWDRILERNPRDLEAQLKRGLALGYAGDWRKAIDSFNLLLKTHPTFAPAWAARAQAYAALAENSNAVMRSARALAAIQDLNRAIEFEPGNAQFFFQPTNGS